MSRARIRLPDRVLAAMRREAERHFPAESGGVLLGYIDPGDPKHIQVLKQVGPGPKAVHRRHRFEPDGSWQARRIDAAYRNSDNLVRYLGDWHSHPRGGGRPSDLDRSTAAKIAAEPLAQAAHPLMVILHGGPEQWDVAGYRFGRRRLRPAKVSLVDRRWAGPEASDKRRDESVHTLCAGSDVKQFRDGEKGEDHGDLSL